MKTFNEQEVVELFDKLFLFDEYKNAYVTSAMAINHLKKNGMTLTIKGEEVECKTFRLIK